MDELHMAASGLGLFSLGLIVLSALICRVVSR